MSVISTLINGVICLILMLCCFFSQSVEASSEDISGETFALRAAFDATDIAKIAYYIDTTPVAERTEQYNTLNNQASVSVGDRSSQYAIQQSIKKLYATQQYSQIQVYAQETPSGVALTYQLTSFARIKAIALIGIPANEFRHAIENAMKSKAGGRYVPAIAKADINRIRRICEAYGYFKAQVTVSDTLTEDSVLTYQISIGEPSTIKQLEILGNFALSTNRLKTACSFSIRAPVYNKAEVDTDVAAMQALYRKNNYPTTTIQPKFTAKTGLLQFHINEGRRVEFRFVSDASEFSASQQGTFKRDIAQLISTGSSALWERRIKAYFENIGYHETTVEAAGLRTASVQLTINPGTRYRVTRVVFSGNRAFSDADLLREMTIKPMGGLLWHLRISNLAARFLSRREQKRFFYKEDLETDKRRLSILYGKAGYPNAAIKVETTDKKQPLNSRNIGEVTIKVSVFEDHKQVIHRCTISDNDAISSATLLEYLESELPLPQPNAVFERTVYQSTLRNVYHKLGYIDVQVDSAYIPETKTPVFKVEGNFSEALVDGELPSKVREAFKEHDLTLAGLFIAATEVNDNSENLDNTQSSIRSSIRDFQENPRYTLKQEATHLEVFEHGILALIVQQEGEQRAFGKFRFEGDTDVVKQHVLQREVQHLEGNRWTSDRLSGALQNLYGLGIFRSVQSERIEDNAAGEPVPQSNSHPALKTSDVLITLEKQPPRTYSYGGGYSFAEGWNGTLELTDRNFLFKRNIRGYFRSRLGWRDELGYLVDARLTEPWLINRTRGTLQVSAKKLEVDDNVRALQGSFILSRKLGESHHLDLRYSYRDLNQPVPEIGQAIPTEIGLPKTQDPFRTTVSSLRFSWTYDARIRYLNPIGGMFNEITLEYAGGPVLQGGTSFIKTTTDTRYYQSLIGDLVLASAVRCGITTGLRSNRSAELISFERFWAGGSTTVRGYTERSLGPEDIFTGIHRGDVQFIFNTELRFPIYSVVRGAFFFDAGNVWDALADIETLTRLPSSVGAGLYLDFGPLTVGVDYAIPLIPVPSSPDTRMAHIRLGSTF